MAHNVRNVADVSAQDCSYFPFFPYPTVLCGKEMSSDPSGTVMSANFKGVAKVSRGTFGVHVWGRGIRVERLQ